MIQVDLKRKTLCISLDREHPYYTRAYIILRSLLSVRSSGANSNFWTISFDDFLTYKKKLDSLGLVEGRTMSAAAHKHLLDISAQNQRNEGIKSGIHNSFVQGLLEGKLKTIPYEDQITGISYLYSNWRAGLFDSMGAGKSLMGLGTIVALQQEVRKTLVICPKSVMMGFAREIEKHTHLKCASIPPGRVAALSFLQENKDGDWDILLVHPENLIRSAKKSKKRSNSTEVYGGVTKLLKTIKFDMIIVDEWHQYKNLSAKRTKCVLSILGEVRNRNEQLCRVVLMTGTPISESPVNSYVTLKVLGHDFLPHSTRFENYFTLKKSIQVPDRRKHSRKGSKMEIQKVVGYKNLQELKDRIERYSIRRTKDDLQGFPDKVLITRDVTLSGGQKALYKTVCGELRDSLPRSSAINLAEFFSGNAKEIRLRQLMNHPAFLDEECESAKYAEVDIILDELFADPEQKVVIWTEYRKAIDLIYDRWNSQYGVVKIYGGVEINDKLANSFENEEKPRIAACIPAKAGTGVDFLARARTAIYIDRPYSFTLYNQSLDRIHRRVKTSGKLSKLDRIRSQPATLIFLDIPNSIDEAVRDKLSGKQDIADAIMTSDSKLITMGRSDLLKYLR